MEMIKMFRSIFKPRKTKLEIDKLVKKVHDLENLVNTKVSKDKLLEEIKIQQGIKKD